MQGFKYLLTSYHPRLEILQFCFCDTGKSCHFEGRQHSDDTFLQLLNKVLDQLRDVKISSFRSKFYTVL
ncbi:unnamed protein product [Allacma fusca]|uniref:Uncharacterized protein n=1 Tax=Allacma fusca TaxID=39272 RepID=A0A8J2PYW4_9HEXA|nr:unnamed protein product [Allacma fusca]